MTTSRRAFLAAGASLGLAATAGCLDFVQGNEPLEFHADRVAPAQSALEDTEYEERAIEKETIEESVEAGVEREVRATVWLSSYTKEMAYQDEQQEASLFTAISIPGMEVAGRSFNPIDDMTNEELLDEFVDEMDGEHGQVEDLDHQETYTLEVLDGTRDVDVFLGETEFQGERVDVELRMTSFDHEGDILVLLGSYPEMLADEGPTIDDLMKSVEHPAEN
ncbi:DUF6517 family protein [Halosolutus amylolyticus]|uniref:DUF6517 family protein n=1 Tax=Halosolutus amylolyticus TaxID=2932267 RepID=A0ABD5PNP8_9EURY|nr:DUF6517 family protein [Halosolutus amylolyticus]